MLGDELDATRAKRFITRNTPFGQPVKRTDRSRSVTWLRHTYSNEQNHIHFFWALITPSAAEFQPRINDTYRELKIWQFFVLISLLTASRTCSIVITGFMIILRPQLFSNGTTLSVGVFCWRKSCTISKFYHFVLNSHWVLELSQAFTEVWVTFRFKFISFLVQLSITKSKKADFLTCRFIILHFKDSCFLIIVRFTDFHAVKGDFHFTQKKTEIIFSIL